MLAGADVQSKIAAHSFQLMETSSSGGSFWIFVLSIFGLFLCQFLSRFSKRQNLCFLLSSCGKNCTRHRSWESNWESHGVSATYSGIKLSYQALSLDSKWCDLVDAKISPSQNVPPKVFSITSHWWASWKQCDEIITKDADKKKKRKGKQMENQSELWENCSSSTISFPWVPPRVHH